MFNLCNFFNLLFSNPNKSELETKYEMAKIEAEIKREEREEKTKIYKGYNNYDANWIPSDDNYSEILSCNNKKEQAFKLISFKIRDDLDRNKFGKPKKTFRITLLSLEAYVFNYNENDVINFILQDLGGLSEYLGLNIDSNIIISGYEPSYLEITVLDDLD